MKPATAKVKGRQTEAALVDWLRVNGVPHAERRRLTGAEDQGDIAGWVGVVVECKSGARLDLAGWCKELAREIRHANAVHGMLAIRPKGKPDPEEWWAVMPLPAILKLFREAGWCADDPTDQTVSS